MEQKLDFSLPKKKTKGSLASKVAIVLLLVILGLCLGIAKMVSTYSGGADKLDIASQTADQTRGLATKLASRGLHVSAADVWQEYLLQADLTNEETAKILFLVATLFEKAGNNSKAIEYYYRCETAAKIDDLQKDINAGIKRSFEKLGYFSALRYELMDRTGFSGDLAAGSDVLAEIGPQKITSAQLDSLIEEKIDKQLSQYAAVMPADQLTEQKKRMLSQFAAPQARQQFLQMHLAQEVLYRKALDNGLAERDEVRKTIDEITRSVLSQQLLTEEMASKINITETDLRTYYQANIANYVEPQKATIRNILVESEENAKQIIDSLNAGQDFDKLAKELSMDSVTKDNGGLIEAEVIKGQSNIPSFGDVPELNDRIFDADVGSILPAPIKTEKGFHVIKIETKLPSSQKSFDEASQQVMSELTGKKRQEVQQQLILKLMDEYEVITHSTAFTPDTEKEDSEDK